MIPFSVLFRPCNLRSNIIGFVRNAGILLCRNGWVAAMALLLSFSAQADHFAGGEITWECLPNGNYRFILRFYRDCAGVFMPGGMDLHSTSPAGIIKLRAYPMVGFHLQDLTPKCNPDSLFPTLFPVNIPRGLPILHPSPVP